MSIDIPHVLATAAIIFAIVYGINRLPQFETMTKGRRALVTLVVLFVALMILNLVWPSGAAA